MKENFTYDQPTRPTATALVGLSHRGSRVETHAAAANRKIRRREASQCGQPYGGPMGVFAVVEKENGAESIHYVLKDHLGSWTTITDANGNIIREQSFDAWGNMRDPDTWTGTVTQQPMFDRGFTGHEHLNAFGLINMNGRMYDPVMSSFLSVDNYVQCPDFSQNFNRYAYCLNNPLKYTDPSGELFGIDDIMFSMIVYGISSVVINGVVNTCAGRNFYDGSYGAFMGSVMSVGVGGVMGGAASKLVAVGGFVPEGIVQGTSGLFGEYAGGAVGAWCNGGSLRDCVTAGIVGGAIGLGTGFIFGGIQGGLYAMRNGGDFWTGDRTVLGELTIDGTYQGTKTKAQLNSKWYNKSYDSYKNDDILAEKMEEVFDVRAGKYNIKRFTTRSDGMEIDAKYGKTDDYSTYVRLSDKRLVAGYTRQVGMNGTEIHISPKYVASSDVISFKATAGHELLHGIHHFKMGEAFNQRESEIACYDFTMNVYLEANRIYDYNMVNGMAIKLGYFGEDGAHVVHPLYKSPFAF